MGSLTGHVVPGTFFGIFALWWAVDIMIRYFENHFLGKNHHGILRLRPDPQRKTSPTSWGSPLLPPFETSLRFMSVLIGIAGEYVTALDGEGNFRAIHNGQHITMFTFFLLPTLFDIMHFYNVPGVPSEIDLVTAAIAFFMEGFIFLWHLDGRPPLDVQVHTFLYNAAFLCSAITVLEAVRPNNIIPAILRCTFTLWQGAWFYCLGFILYPPPGWAKWDMKGSHSPVDVGTVASAVWDKITSFSSLPQLISDCSTSVTRENS